MCMGPRQVKIRIGVLAYASDEDSSRDIVVQDLTMSRPVVILGAYVGSFIRAFHLARPCYSVDH